MNHAAVWIDHQEARIFAIDQDTFDLSTLKAPHHRVHRKHPATVEHEHPAETARFLHDVARALSEAREILVLGPASAKRELVEHIEKHDHDLAKKIVGVETVDHPTDNQIAAYARKYFVAVDRMR